jgi:hypothetical protein
MHAMCKFRVVYHVFGSFYGMIGCDPCLRVVYGNGLTVSKNNHPQLFMLDSHAMVA